MQVEVTNEINTVCEHAVITVFHHSPYSFRYTYTKTNSTFNKYCTHTIIILQVDQKVSVHLMIIL